MGKLHYMVRDCGSIGLNLYQGGTKLELFIILFGPIYRPIQKK